MTVRDREWNWKLLKWGRWRNDKNDDLLNEEDEWMKKMTCVILLVGAIYYMIYYFM